jgi:hypothetical protein
LIELHFGASHVQDPTPSMVEGVVATAVAALVYISPMIVA